MTITNNGNGEYIGLSTDTKATTGIPAGSSFIETDTGKSYIWNGYRWTIAGYASPHILRVGIIDFGAFGNPTAWGILGTTSPKTTSGTGTTAALGPTTTEGQGVTHSTGTTTGSNVGFGYGSNLFMFGAQLYLRFRFRINQATTNNRFWLGILNSSSIVAGDTPLANLRGVMFGYPLGGTNYTVIQNNSSASQYDNLASTTSFPVNAVDTNWHTVELYSLDNGAHIQYSLDGAAPFTLSTTQLPSTTLPNCFWGYMTNNGANNCTFDAQYLFMSESPNNK